MPYDRQFKNIAYIDGQNLYMGTTKKPIEPWYIDLRRFRIYLEQKYSVGRAYYFLGYIQDGKRGLYELIQHSGFVLVFRAHNPAMMCKKKGNVDSDIIFSIMKKLYKKEDFEKVILISGDGDYKLLVDFLIEETRLAKILFPDKKRASSLYKKLSPNYYDSLDSTGVRNKIEVKEKGSLGN